MESVNPTPQDAPFEEAKRSPYHFFNFTQDRHEREELALAACSVRRFCSIQFSTVCKNLDTIGECTVTRFDSSFTMSCRRTQRTLAVPIPKVSGLGTDDTVANLPAGAATSELSTGLEVEPTEISLGSAADEDRAASTTLPKMDPERATLWLRRADQLFLGFLVFSLLALLIAFRWRLAAGGRAEIEITNQRPREFFYAIEINQASWVEWAQLDGIGEKLARRIVDDRAQRGPFKSIEDVARVRGLGMKLIEKLRPFLRYDDPVKELR